MIYADALCILLSCAGPYFFYFLSFIQEPMDESMPSIVGDPVAESTLAYVGEQPSLQVSVS